MSILHKAHGHAKRHYEKHYKARYQERAHLVFLLDAILVSIAIFLLGLGLFFRWFYHPLRDDFKLSLLTEQTITSGKETIFSVRIVNGGTTDLHGAKLVVHLPDVFVRADMPPKYDAKKDEIDIGEMPAHVSNEYRFRGTLLGSEGSADLYVHFTATNDEGRSDEKLTKGTLRWTHNAIEARFEAPEAVVPGQSTTFAIRVKNGSSFAFDAATIHPTWPKGFRLQNATPPVYHDEIALGRLEMGEETVVKFAGRMNGVADLQRFAATLRGTLGGQPFELARAQADVRMASVDLKLEAAFAEAAPNFVRPGQEVPVIVRYRNDGKQTIKNVILSITPDASTLDGVRWETSSRIDMLAAGASGERRAFVRVKDAVSRYVANPMFRAIPQAIFSIDDPKIVDAEIAGSAIETKIAGSAKLRVAARYFTSEGDQLGRGPLPPKVGKATTYWMFASLETGASDIQNGIATFRLPIGVAWTGRAAVTAGQELSLEGDRLMWRIGTTSAHAGLLSEAPSASFEISFTPTTGQVGTAPLLLSEAAYAGEDAWTAEPLASSQGGLTTQLPGDPAVAGRSLVRP